MTVKGEERGGALRGAGLWLPTFDGIRGFCTLGVALVHVMLAVGWSPQHELPGGLRYSAFFLIEFLFVIAGFVALLPLAGGGRFGGTGAYALRRLGRLVPLYYLTIVAAVALGGLLRPVSGASASPHDFWAVLAHLGFVQHQVFPYRAGFGVQGIVWTLSIAASFYVVFPFVAERWRRHPFLWLAAAAALAVAWRQLVNDPEWYLQFPLFCADFAIGMTAACVYANHMRPGQLRISSGASLAWFAAGVGALVPLLYLSGLPVYRRDGLPWGEGWVLALVVPAIFAAVLLIAPNLPRWARMPFDNRVSRFLGRISYGVFLFHFLVIWLVLRFVDIPRGGSPQGLVELAALVLPITILLAWLGTDFVEKPIRKRAQQRAAWLGTSRPAGAPAGVGPLAQAAARNRVP